MNTCFYVEGKHCPMCGHTMISDGREIYCPNMCAGDEEIIEYDDENNTKH